MDLLARTHFARVIVADKKAENVRHVFQNYLVEGKPGFVAHEWAETAEDIAFRRTKAGLAMDKSDLARLEAHLHKSQAG